MYSDTWEICVISSKENKIQELGQMFVEIISVNQKIIELPGIKQLL